MTTLYFYIQWMESFQVIYKRIQENLYRINKVGSEFRKLVTIFNEEIDLPYILNELDKYDITKDYVEYENFITFIWDEEFREKLTPEWKSKLFEKMRLIIDEKEFRMNAQYSIFHHLLNGIFLYAEAPSYVSMLYEVIISDHRDDVNLDQTFEDYFRKHDMKDDFEIAFFRWIEYSKGDKFSYFLHQELREYVLKYDDILLRFIRVSYSSDELIMKFFSSIYQEAYRGEEDKKDILKTMFLEKVETLEASNEIIEELNTILRKLLRLEVNKLWKKHYHELNGIIKNTLISELAQLLINKGYSFFHELTGEIRDTRPSDSIIDFMSRIIRVSDAESICKIYIGREEQNMLRSIRLRMYDVINNKHPEKKEIIEVFNKYLGEDIQARDQVTQKYREEQEEKENKRKEEFQANIKIARGSVEGKDIVSGRLIYNYANAKEDKQESRFSADDKEFIRTQVQLFFDDKKHYLPENGELHVDKENKNSYTAPAYIVQQTFYYCLLLAREFEIDLVKYTYKIITYLPFAYDDGRKFVFDNIEHIGKEEVDYLLSVYSKERDEIDDLRLHNPVNFVRTYDKYKEDFHEYDTEKKAITNLKQFIIDQEGAWINEEILKILWEELDDSSFFQDFFDKRIIKGINYFNSVLSGTLGLTQEEIRTYESGLKANEILISRFNDDEAIKRRFDQLLSADVRIPERPSWVVMWMSELESEIIFHSYFTEPLKKLVGIKYKDFFLKLLTHSFNLKIKNPKDSSFVWYLWEVILAYFKNVKNREVESEIKKICAQYEEQSYFFRSNYLNND